MSTAFLSIEMVEKNPQRNMDLKLFKILEKKRFHNINVIACKVLSTSGFSVKEIVIAHYYMLQYFGGWSHLGRW